MSLSKSRMRLRAVVAAAARGLQRALVVAVALIAAVGAAAGRAAATTTSTCGHDALAAQAEPEVVATVSVDRAADHVVAWSAPPANHHYDDRSYLVRAFARSDEYRSAPQTGADCEMVPAWFGQARISPNFRSGRSIQDPPIGRIKVFTDARAPGVYIAESNRTLASCSLAGAPTAPACMMSSVPANVRNRLKADPWPPQTSLPSPVVPVTKSVSDLTPVAPYEVTSTVSVPRSLPPC